MQSYSFKVFWFIFFLLCFPYHLFGLLMNSLAEFELCPCSQRNCIGCRWHYVSSWGAAASASVRGDQGLYHASSSWLSSGPLQGTDKPVRDTGGTSGNMYLRKGKMQREKGQHQGQSSRRGTTAELLPPQRDWEPWMGPSRVEEMTTKEGAAEEKSEEQGATERSHGVLTPTIASQGDGAWPTAVTWEWR